MLLRVLVVDDDIVTRTNMSTLLDWEKHGFELAGTAVNGENALQLIESCLPDIVITDMSMPVMDGIVLIESIEHRYPHIKIIALSGYDDFDYVRQSMKKGAIDYLLKHKLTSELLLATLDTARQCILGEKKELADKHHTREQLASAKDMLTQEFIRKLLSGELADSGKIENDLQQLDINLDLKNLIVVAVELDDYSFIEDTYPARERDKLVKAFIEIARDILNERARTFIGHIGKGAFVIIFSFGDINSSAYIYNHITSAIERIKTSIKRYLNITACFGVSGECRNITDLSGFYREAQLLLKERFYEGKDRILRQNSTEKTPDRFISLDLKDERNLVLNIKSFEKQEVHQIIGDIFNRIVNDKVNYQAVQMIAAELFNIASKIARESDVDFSEFIKDIPFKTLQKYDTAADIKEWILGIYDKLIKTLQTKDPDSDYSEITKKAVSFIHTNYRKSLSLNTVAEHIGVNSSYLSHVFKEDIGKGFVEYLNSIRIEKARMLIESGNAGIKAIVAELGFSSYNYFFKVFKEFVGMTPLEYEESCRNKIDKKAKKSHLKIL